mgnify:CR=1 FL=1
MSNQVVLSALKAQLEAKDSEYNQYKAEVYIPQNEKITAEIVKWFQTNVNSSIEKLTASERSIEIPSFANRWQCVSLSIDNYWNKDSVAYRMRLSTNSRNIKHDETSELLDLIVAGAVAIRFSEIEQQLLKVWGPMFEKVSTPLNDLGREINTLKSGIAGVESDIAEQDKLKYFKPGFELTLKKSKTWSWAADEVREVEGTVKLQYGRSNYDSVHAKAYKIIGKRGIKHAIEITDVHNRLRTYEVTAMRLKDFIDEVYLWETKKADESTKRAEEKEADYKARTQKA